MVDPKDTLLYGRIKENAADLRPKVTSLRMTEHVVYREAVEIYRASPGRYAINFRFVPLDRQTIGVLNKVSKSNARFAYFQE